MALGGLSGRGGEPESRRLAPGIMSGRGGGRGGQAEARELPYFGRPLAPSPGRPLSSETGLLVEIRLQHVTRDGGGELAVSAMVVEGHHHYFGRLARREAHEPGVIFELFPRFALQEFVGGKLGGAGLAAHIEARELRADARAALVHHAVSSINHFGDIVRRKRPTVLLILAALD